LIFSCTALSWAYNIENPNKTATSNRIMGGSLSPMAGPVKGRPVWWDTNAALIGNSKNRTLYCLVLYAFVPFVRERAGSLSESRPIGGALWWIPQVDSNLPGVGREMAPRQLRNSRSTYEPECLQETYPGTPVHQRVLCSKDDFMSRSPQNADPRSEWEASLDNPQQAK
jgi:hypothetical protein